MEKHRRHCGDRDEGRSHQLAQSDFQAIGQIEKNWLRFANYNYRLLRILIQPMQLISLCGGAALVSV
jgi:hypothetical protein